MTDQNNNHPHLRFNFLTGEYVLVCPNRTKRPWSGLIEKEQEKELPEYDPKDPLCPSNKRPCGEQNLDYKSTFVFENDYPALIETNFKDQNPQNHIELNNQLDDKDFDFFKSTPVQGTCKVICFHPKHNLSVAEMDHPSLMNVINLWINQTLELKDKFEHVQLFETKGDIMGCSNSHPHGQIWASNFLPNEVHKKNQNQLKYYQKHGKTLLNDYLAKELIAKDRIILINNDFVVLIPFFAYWPFETMILPLKRNIKRIIDLTETEKQSLADILKRLLVKYDNLFECSFPYAFGWQGAPTGKYLNSNTDHWTLHGIFYPPLLRSAKIKKFVASYELLAMPQRDLTPEQAAERLRSIDDKIHYRSKK